MSFALMLVFSLLVTLALLPPFLAHLNEICFLELYARPIILRKRLEHQINLKDIGKVVLKP